MPTRSHVLGFLWLPALALLASAGCTEIADITTATPEEATKLANIRADLEQDKALVDYQRDRKKEAENRGENPDQYDNAELLRVEQRFADRWAKIREVKFREKRDAFLALSTDVVRHCTDRANETVTQNKALADENRSILDRRAHGEKTDALKPLEDPADIVDKCLHDTKPEARIDWGIVGLFLALGLVLAGAGVGLFRSARRHIDPVALAGQSLSLSTQQGPATTVLTGEYEGFVIKVEASAPGTGQGDGFMRALVLSRVHAHTVVRFGPLAPPPGLDLPDLDAPEIQDDRIPEGYKMRLTPGTSPEPLLSGDVGFQLRAFDPIDVRVHDGIAALTTWQVAQGTEKVVEFIDLALAVAKLYPLD
jgi:hypothetical protein